jgi:outer membrane protein OmpA-like peptidoglycan-associated protein
VISSCGSPPRPPTVDESRKRPVNSAAALETQGCKTDLQNAHILLKEATRLAESASAAAVRSALGEQTSRRLAEQNSSANTVYTVHFDFGSARVSIPDADAGDLVAQGRSAPLVMLRGRTDGQTDSPAESRIARERAVAVRAYLVQAGVAPERIRITWQPVGDTVSDNSTPSSRAQNRRVEIEFYQLPPTRFSKSAAGPSV